MKNSARLTNFGFVLLFVLVFIFMLINEYNFQFLYNGFGKLSGQDFQVYYLDVGQASATLVILPSDRTMMFDTGSQESQANMLESVDLILSKNRLSKIDILVLTHSDEDHIGGTVGLLKKYQVDFVYRPKVLSTSESEVFDERFKVVDSLVYKKAMDAVFIEPNCQVEFTEDKLFVEKDECTVEFFTCKEDSYSDTNSYSPFIVVNYKEKVFMFCGDVTEQRETEIISELQAQDRKFNVDFLLVSHHGAKSSTSEAFLDVFKPTYAVVSAGDELHPTKAVLDRLNKSGVEDIFCTKTDGMIAVSVLYSGAFIIKTMDKFIDFPLFICIIFVIGAVWNFYLIDKKKLKKFSF